MFDIGWGELVVIGIVALIAIGPKELPTVLRTIGQYMGKVRRMANEFQGQFQEALREAEVSDLKKQADDWKTTVTDFSNFDPLADKPKSDEPAAVEPVDPAALLAANAEAASAPPDALPEPAQQVAIDVPLPEPPAPVTNEDFATAEPLPPSEPPKQAGGGA
jgi:sec-independent protein translocase protein TatB